MTTTPAELAQLNDAAFALASATASARTTPHAEQLPADLAVTEEERTRKWFVGSIDQGTTSSRFIIFDGDGVPVASHQIEFENLYPRPGWHEHDPMALLASVEACVERAIIDFVALGHDTRLIRAVGITNQRETTLVWDAETGEPLHNAVVWPDTRTASLVR